jgi:hypothetical protein
MPPVSESQRRAMFAAKAGKSTLGIPQSVGAEFVKADKGGKLPQRKEGGGAVKKYDEGGPVDAPNAPMRSESTEHAKAQRKAEQINRTQFWPMEKNRENIREMERAGPYAKGGPVKGYAKGGDVRVQEDRARGGPSITTRSRFLKTKDVFRDDVERNDYDKTSPGGELSKTEGDTKSQKAVKPRG